MKAMWKERERVKGEREMLQVGSQIGSDALLVNNENTKPSKETSKAQPPPRSAKKKKSRKKKNGTAPTDAGDPDSSSEETSAEAVVTPPTINPLPLPPAPPKTGFLSLEGRFALVENCANIIAGFAAPPGFFHLASNGAEKSSSVNRN